MAVGLRSRFEGVKEKIRLHGDAAQHEQTDQWSNRDLIPLPPSRRTWGKSVKFLLLHTKFRPLLTVRLGWFHYYGFWTLSSLNITNWQTPSSFLSE